MSEVNQKISKPKTMIKIKDLVVDYGESIAINKLNLSIKEGELVTLLGPSGCGKSTTLNSIAGLISVTSGKIIFDGKNVTKLSPKQRNLGLVFQSYALYPHMSVYDNISFPLESNKQFQKEFLAHNQAIDDSIEAYKFSVLGKDEKEYYELLEKSKIYSNYLKKYKKDLKLAKLKSNDRIEQYKDSIHLNKVHMQGDVSKESENAMNKLDDLANLKKDLTKEKSFIKSEASSIKNNERLSKIEKELLTIPKSKASILDNYEINIKKIKSDWKDNKEDFKNDINNKIADEKENLIKLKEKINLEYEELLEKSLLTSEEANKLLVSTLKEFKSNDEHKRKINDLKSKKLNYRNEVDKAVKDIAEKVGILEQLNKRPPQLSGGQQQRVAISRALVKKTNILLLDEPLSNLDAKTRISTRMWIRDLQQQLKITTVFVTHDQEEAMSISDRIICMNKGDVQQFDTPMEMYNNPSNKFVAGFLGVPSMNFFTDGEVWEKINTKNKKAPNKAEFGVRPENIKEHSELEENEKALLTVEGEIISIQSLGKETLITVQVESDEIKLFIKNLSYKTNDKIKITFVKNSIFMFDKKTEKTIGRM